MQIKYSISLWNYLHYANVPSLENIAALLREHNYGIELWGSWKKEDLYGEIGRKKLKLLLHGMRVSLHTVMGINTFDLHKKQIDAAAELGAEIVVVHPDGFFLKDSTNLDVELCRETVMYASEHGVRLALENGELSFLAEAVEKVEGLGICLDVGHVYFTKNPMSGFLNALKERLIHLHIQDILPKDEDNLPFTGKDHFIPGTGGIPVKDWMLVIETLKKIDYRGIAVFEIQPRNPLQTAFHGMNFMRKLLDKI